MSAFDFAVAVLLRQEGGLVDDPHDEGGLTNFGISFRFYKTIYPNATQDDLRVLNKDDAINFYQKHFWDESKWSEITSQLVTNQAFDMHVSMGLAPAIKILQRASYSVYGQNQKILDDGIFGDSTLFFINSCRTLDLLIAIRSERAGYYREIVARNPHHQVHLEGWLNRAYRV